MTAPTVTSTIHKHGAADVVVHGHGSIATSFRPPVPAPVNQLSTEQATMAGGAQNFLDDWASAWWVLGHCGIGPATVGGRSALRAWRTPGTPIVFRPNATITAPTVANPNVGRQSYPTTPAQRYTFMVDVWADGPGYEAKLQVEFFAADGTTVVSKPASTQSLAAQAWQHCAVTVAAPAGAAIARPMVRVINPTRVPDGQNMLTQASASAEPGTLDGWRGRGSTAMRFALQQTHVTHGAWGVEVRSNATSAVVPLPMVPSPAGQRIDWFGDYWSDAATPSLQWWRAWYDDDLNLLGSGFGSGYTLTPGAWTNVRLARNSDVLAAYTTWGWNPNNASMVSADFSIPYYIDRRGAIANTVNPPWQEPQPDQFVAISQAGFYEGDVPRWSATPAWAPSLLSAQQADIETNVNGSGTQRVADWVQAGTSVMGWDATRANTGTHSLSVSHATSTGPGTFAGQPGTLTQLRWPVTPGQGYTFLASARPLTPMNTCNLVLEWYNAAGTLLSSWTTPAYPTDLTRFVTLACQGIAPANAATVGVRVTTNFASAPVQVLLDTFGVYAGYVGAWVHPDTPRPPNAPLRPATIGVGWPR